MIVVWSVYAILGVQTDAHLYCTKPIRVSGFFRITRGQDPPPEPRAQSHLETFDSILSIAQADIGVQKNVQNNNTCYNDINGSCK